MNFIDKIRKSRARKRFFRTFSKREKDLLLRGLEARLDQLLAMHLHDKSTAQDASEFYEHPPAIFKETKELHEKIYLLIEK